VLERGEHEIKKVDMVQ